MWQTLGAWAADSRVVQLVEAFCLRLMDIFRGSILGALITTEWQDRPQSYQESTIRRLGSRLLTGLLNWRLPAAWIQGSGLLGVLPQWLADDLTWLWCNSWLARVWTTFAWLTVDEAASAPKQAATNVAPPLWRWVLYVLTALSAGLALWQLESGLLIVKLLLAGIALLIIWARPQWAIFMVAVLFPLLPVVSTTLLIFWALLASWLQGHLKARSSLLVLLAVVVTLALLAAALHSQAPLASLRYLRYYMAGVALLILMINGLESEHSLRQLLGVALAAAGLIACWGVLQYLAGKATNISWVDIRYSAIKTRVVGPFDNPNMFAAYLVMMLPFPLARMIERGTPWRQRLANTFLAGLLGLTLVLTFSRGAWLAAAAVALVLASYLRPRLFWAVPLVLIIAPFLLPEMIWQRLASIVNLEDTSNMVRLYIWNSSLQMWLHNFWLGIGLGLLPYAAIYRIFQYGAVPALHAHNLFLQVAVEGGGLALAAFALLCLGLWRATISQWRLSPWLAVGTAAALIGHLTQGLFDYTWYDMRLLTSFWLVAGLALAGFRQRTGKQAG